MSSLSRSVHPTIAEHIRRDSFRFWKSVFSSSVKIWIVERTPCSQIRHKRQIIFCFYNKRRRSVFIVRIVNWRKFCMPLKICRTFSNRISVESDNTNSRILNRSSGAYWLDKNIAGFIYVVFYNKTQICHKNQPSVVQLRNTGIIRPESMFIFYNLKQEQPVFKIFCRAVVKFWSKIIRKIRNCLFWRIRDIIFGNFRFCDVVFIESIAFKLKISHVTVRHRNKVVHIFWHNSRKTIIDFIYASRINSQLTASWKRKDCTFRHYWKLSRISWNANSFFVDIFIVIEVEFVSAKKVYAACNFYVNKTLRSCLVFKTVQSICRFRTRDCRYVNFICPF